MAEAKKEARRPNWMLMGGMAVVAGAIIAIMWENQEAMAQSTFGEAVRNIVGAQDPAQSAAEASQAQEAARELWFRQNYGGDGWTYDLGAGRYVSPAEKLALEAERAEARALEDNPQRKNNLAQSVLPAALATTGLIGLAKYGRPALKAIGQKRKLKTA